MFCDYRVLPFGFAEKNTDRDTRPKRDHLWSLKHFKSRYNAQTVLAIAYTHLGEALS